MLTGTIFLATWTFFDATYNARFYAAIVPATVTVQFFAVGIGILPVRRKQIKDLIHMCNCTDQQVNFSQLMIGPRHCKTCESNWR
jgi:hypothetical protein